MAGKKLSDKAMALKEYLEESLAPQKIKVRFNRNRSTYLSAVHRDDLYVVSVHEAFTEAPEPIWKRLAQFYRRATKQVRFELEQYIHNLSPEIWQSYARKAPVLPAVGEFYDLNEVMLRAVALGFDSDYPSPLPRIGWSPCTRGRYVSRLGSYDVDSNSISISSRLDDKDLPLDFLGVVVFHELLHGVHRPKVTEDLKRRVHTREFTAAEKLYVHYEWAKQWEKENLDKLFAKQYRRIKRKKKK